MRVLNDREEKTEPSDLGILQVFSYALFCAAGISTLVFAPVPMILAHLRLPEGQAKLSALIGAVIALTFLEIPLHFVVLAFVFGIFIGDGVARERRFWPFLAAAGAVAAVVGIGTIASQAMGDNVSLLPYWRGLVHTSVAELQKSVQNQNVLNWGQLENLLLYEGPSLFVCAGLLSFWMSVGLVAHLGWFPETHPLAGANLRKLKIPTWAVFAFFGLTILSVVGPEWLQRTASSFVRLIGTLLFIQGCLALSQLLKKRQARPKIRTMVYLLSVVFGFYMLVAVGVMSPWLARRQKRAAEALTTVET